MQMRYIVISFFFIFSLFSCSQKRKEKTIDLSDITTSSERYKEGEEKKDSTAPLVMFTDSLLVSYLGILDSLKLDYSSIQKLDTVLFPDRFGAKSIVKFYWKEKKDSINFMDWEFKDSIKTTNAFYNWIDCFGSKCRSIKIGEKIKIQKRSLLVLVNEKHMIAVDSERKIDNEKWLKLLKDQGFGESWKYIVSQPNKGKANWLNYKNEIFTEIKQ